MDTLEEWEDWSNELASILPEDAESWPGVNPEGAQESVIVSAVSHLLAERENRQELLDALEALATDWYDELPDGPRGGALNMASAQLRELLDRLADR